MKKLSAILTVCALFAVSLTGCGNAKNAVSETPASSQNTDESASSQNTEVSEPGSEKTEIEMPSLPIEPVWQIEPVYDILNPFSDPDTPFTTASRGGQWYLIDKDGKEVKELPFNDEFLEKHFAASPYEEGRGIRLYGFSDGLAKVTEFSDYTNAAVGYIDADGELVIDFTCTADEIEDGSERLGTASGAFGSGLTWTAPASTIEWNTDVFRFIDKTGNVVFHSPEGVVRTTGSFSEGLCGQIMDDGSIRFVDTEGRAAITVSGDFSNVGKMKNGYAWFTDADGMEGLLDKNGSIVLEAVYAGVGDVNEDGICYFRDASADKAGLMTVEGEIVLPAQYADLYAPVGGVTYFSLDGENYGMMDAEGNVIIEPQFSRILYTNGVITACDQNGLWGIIKNPLA